MELFYRNLRYLTEKSNLSAISKEAGLSAGYLANIIRAKSACPNFKIVLAVKKHFGVSLDDLFYTDIEKEREKMKNDNYRKLLEIKAISDTAVWKFEVEDEDVVYKCGDNISVKVGHGLEVLSIKDKVFAYAKENLLIPLMKKEAKFTDKERYVFSGEEK